MKICFAKVSALTFSVQVYNLTELKILFSVENSKLCKIAQCKYKSLTVWHEIFAEGFFCELGIFYVLRELIFASLTNHL